MTRPKRPQSDISRNVLQDPHRTREQSAWELLHAIGELFPDRLAALLEIGQRAVNASIDELPENDPHNQKAVTHFERAGDEWTERNAVQCVAMIDAAAEFARGGTPSAGLYVDAHFDEDGHFVIARQQHYA